MSRRMVLSAALVVVGLLLCAGGPGFAGETGFDMEVCQKAAEKACPEGVHTKWVAYYRCIEEHLKEFPKECREEVEGSLKLYKMEIEGCGEDYRRLCGVDIERIQAKDYERSMEKVMMCVGEKAGLLSDSCWEFVTGMMGPLFEGVDREKLRQEALQKMQRRTKVQVKGKAVMAEAREGDLIWYEAKVREKKTLDRYPFCPEVKGKGLEVVNAWRKGDCFYRVTAPWGGGVIEDLRKSDMLEKITNWGIRRQELIETDQTIRKIVEKYTSNCPERFELDVTNYEVSKQQIVMCGGKFGYDTCQEGYLRSSYDDGFLGCVKYAGCKATNPRYIDVGGGCFECEAGGCIDYERWVELGVGAICKVNYKDPMKTTPCKPYKEQE